jgi:hypothetical protein
MIELVVAVAAVLALIAAGQTRRPVPVPVRSNDRKR